MSRVRHNLERDRQCLKNTHMQDRPCVREPDSEVICDRQNTDTVSEHDVASEHVGLDADGKTSLNKIKLSEVGKLHLLLPFS